MTRHLMIGTPCPSCHTVLDGASNTRRGYVDPPVAGDVTVCVYCAAPLQFDADLNLVQLSEEEISELDLATRRELRRAVAAVLQALRERGGQ